MADAQVTTSTIDGNTVLEVIPNDSKSIRLNTNNTYVDRDIVINIEGKRSYFPITEDMVTVVQNATKGVAPYRTSYGTTDITIAADAGVEWVEGAAYMFVVDTTMVVASAYRNVRVRIGDGAWIPVMTGTNDILAGNSYFTKNVTRMYIYKSVHQPDGALHWLQDDNTNTTYTYLVNTVNAENITIDANGYGARYSLIFPTTPLGSSSPRWSSFVTSSGTGTTKTLCSSDLTYYLDRHYLYVYSANIAAGATAANDLYRFYQTTDLRYTTNLLTDYVAANTSAFLYLRNFNPEDMSFKNVEAANKPQIISDTKLAVAFPDTLGDTELYLLYLGEIGANGYALQPEREAAVKIFKYNPSTGDLTPYTGTGASVVNNSSHSFFTITDSTDDLTVATTTGIASSILGAENCGPYNPDKAFVNYTINKAGVEWVEGAIYCFVLPDGFNTKATNTKANGRVRIYAVNKDLYYPLMKDETTAFNMFTEYSPSRDRLFILKKTTTTPNGGLYLLPSANANLTLGTLTYNGSKAVTIPEGGVGYNDASSVKHIVSKEYLPDDINEEYYSLTKDLFTNPTTTSSNASSVINAAIQAAHDAGKAYVLIPDGEYWLTETIYLMDDVILCGCGMDGTTLKIADDCDIDAIRVHGPVSNSGIMDLTIDGNRIRNYSVYSAGHHGNAINVWLHYGRIERVRTDWVYKHQLMLNYDVGSGDDGLGFDAADEYKQGNLNKVLWCDFRDSLSQAVMWGWRTMDSWMCYTNIGSNAANLYLEGGTSRFIGNHFDGDGDNGHGPEYNVYCGDGCNTMLFDGNIFENTQKQNIYFRKPSYANSTRTISITNNIIRTCSKSTNNTYPNIYISGYNADYMAENIIISGNQILNPDTNANHGPCGVELDFCKYVKLSGNTFFNVGTNRTNISANCIDVYNDEEGGSDTKVTQTSTSADGAKPILIAKGTTTATDTVYFNTEVTVDPGTGAINAVQYELPQQMVVCSETSTGGWVWHA